MFSASQVSTFEQCPRKWGWVYLEDIRPPPGPAQAKGSALHAYLEVALERRFWDLSDPSWPLVQPAKKLLESVPEEAEIEYYFETKLGPHTLRGYMDLTWLHSPPVVLDHKSTSSFSWCKDAEDLLRDPQATLYAKAAWEKYYEGEPGPIDLVWLYYRTKDAPSTKRVNLRVYPADVQPRLDKTQRTCDRMQEAIDANKRAGDMLPNWDACHMFGGCYFREHCNQEEKAKTNPMAKSDLMARLASKVKHAPTEPAAAPTTAAPAPAGINPPAEEAPAAAPAAAPAETPAAAPPAEAPEQPKAGGTRRTKTTLYVNCMPTTGTKQPVNASSYLEKARTVLGGKHYALADFGKGRGLFADALRKVIEDEGGLPAGVYLWTGSSEGRDAFEVLASFSDTIVQGLPG